MNPKMLVQAMTGSKAQIMLAFLFAGQALDVQGIKEWTGLKRETIYAATDALSGMELIAKMDKLNHGRQVWALGGEMLPLLSTVFQLPGDTPEERLQLPEFVDELERQTQESVKRTPGATTTTTTIEARAKNKSAVVVEAKAGVHKTDSWKAGVRKTDSWIAPEDWYKEPGTTYAANKKACKEANIGEPKASEISKLAHVYPAFILAHVESQDEDSIGMAIHLIIEGEKPRIWRQRREHRAASYLCETCHRYPCQCEDETEEEATPDFGCMWQDEDTHIFQAGPMQGQTRRLPMCKAPRLPGSSHWCKDHYEIGVETYSTGAIIEKEGERDG